MSCFESFQNYALRAIGIGERMLPRQDISVCDQFALIGSGIIWNVYFGVLALLAGFFLAIAIAVGKNSPLTGLRRSAELFIFVFRGSPLFIQFFFGYFLFLSLKSVLPVASFLTNAWAGAVFVLFLNTSAYTAEIFHGALRAIPKGELEAADAYGFNGMARFRRIIWPNMLRLAWPSYTNEAIFLFHGTTLVFFSGFPSLQQRGDALYYANYFADKTYNPFIPYPILAFYFIVLTLLIIGLFNLINIKMNRHLQATPAKIKYRPKLLR